MSANIQLLSDLNRKLDMILGTTPKPANADEKTYRQFVRKTEERAKFKRLLK